MNPLGRGLESLIPDKDPGETEGKQPLDILELQENLPEPVYQMAEVAPAAFTIQAASLPSEEPPPPHEARPFAAGAVGSSLASPVEPSAASDLPRATLTGGKPPVVSPASGGVEPRYVRSRGESVFFIDIDKIEPNPYQPRREFSEESLKSLADSIKVHGVLQPILVSKVEIETPRGLDVRYQLIAGERRWRSSRMAGLHEIPSIVKRDKPPERQKLEWALIENVQREDLNPVERARAFQQLLGEFDLTQRELAERIGKSREYIANTIRLASLPLHIQAAVVDGGMSEGHARALLTLQDLPESQNKLFEDIKAHGLTVRDAELATRALLGIKRPTKRRNAMFLDPEVRSVQARLEEALGTKVLLQKQGERGKIVVEFYSNEELRGILDKLVGEV